MLIQNLVHVHKTILVGYGLWPATSLGSLAWETFEILRLICLKASVFHDEYVVSRIVGLDLVLQLPLSKRPSCNLCGVQALAPEEEFDWSALRMVLQIKKVFPFMACCSSLFSAWWPVASWLLLFYFFCW